jgi:hypothetical protein
VRVIAYRVLLGGSHGWSGSGGRGGGAIR